MSTPTPLPEPATIAEAASDILTRISEHPQYDAFKSASLEYSEDWQCFTGFPVISEWKLEDDAAPLLTEGLRALALKAAVYQHTQDDQAAEIAISVPVDEMTHAMLAQAQLLHRIVSDLGISIIHQTDQEHIDYMGTGYTADCYRAAWGDPPARYWLDHTEVLRRRGVLGELYQQIGMERSGRQHSIAFEAIAA
ncbi:hypothetical protein ACZ90_12690 [Streptomyces albus subsp. albus]|nr:hypothetical protein ACZ90_12690 [Streptomyces albus subsp. albus]